MSERSHKANTFNGEKYVKQESRNCFAIVWFDTEEAATRAASKDCGHFNGGFFHGMPGGRDKSFDHVCEGVQLYAVSYG